MTVATEEAGILEDLVFRWLAARSMSAESRHFGNGSLRFRRKARLQRAPLLRVHLALQQLYMEKRGTVLQSFGHIRLVLVRERVTPDNETLQAATNKLTSDQRNLQTSNKPDKWNMIIRVRI